MSYDKLRNACVAAATACEKLNLEKFTELKSKLDYCIGSYDFDKNPEGLFEFGAIAFKELTDFKTKNPRKINKKVLAGLNTALALK